MKRRAFLCALLLAALPVQARPSASPAACSGMSRPIPAASHVYGTIHVPDPRLAQLPPQVKARLDAARSLMLEFVPDPYSRERFLEAAMFLDRQTLTEKIGAEDFEHAFEHLAPTGLSRDVVNKLKPWGVLLNLRNPRRVEHGRPRQPTAELARARRLPLHQIEGVEGRSSLSTSFPWSRRSRSSSTASHIAKSCTSLPSAQWKRTRRAILRRSGACASTSSRATPKWRRTRTR